MILNVPDTLRGMTTEQKVGQLFVLTWKNLREAQNNLSLHPGGFIRIYSDVLTVAKDSAAIQAQSEIPLIIAADLERGIGGTIGGALEVMTCMGLGATNDPQAAFDAGRMIGEEAAAFGVNMDYAPVLDVNSNPKNPVINTRSFGGDPQRVAAMGTAFFKGLQAAGILCCGKHFPGHGDSGFDSHASLGSVNGSRDQLETVELVPFRAAIREGIDAIMSAHLIVPSLDEEPIPATLSHKIMTQLLRNELGFHGVAVTDALDMGAIASNFPPETSIPRAVNAGCDQLIMPNDAPFAYNILLSAVKRGDVTEERLNEAVTRVLTMKAKVKAKPAALAELPSRVAVPANLERAREIATQSVTLVRDTGSLLPLDKTKNHFCLLFSNGSDGRSGYLEPASFPDHLAQDGWNVSRLNVWTSIANQNFDGSHMLAMATESDVILLAAYVNIRLSSGTIDLPGEIISHLQPLFNLGKPVILVSFGSPYIGTQFPQCGAIACGYGATQPTQQAMAQCMKGLCPFVGEAPIPLGYFD